MFQFFKYLFLTLGLGALFNLFRSNQEVSVPLHFKIPLLGDFLTEPVPVFYLIILAFCVGAILISLLGALRYDDVSRQRREIKKLKKEMIVGNNFEPKPARHDELPALYDE